MENLQVFLRNVAPSYPAWEYTFAASFAVINAALYHAISINMMQIGQIPYHDSVTGATRYCIHFPSGEDVLVFVLQRSDTITTIKVHPMVKHEDIVDPQPKEETEQAVACLLSVCLREATHAMRYTNSDFTIRPIAQLTPPPPLAKDQGWEQVFHWQQLYARSMSDAELAATQNVTERTVWNERSSRGLSKRTPRGKPRREEAQK